MATGARVATAEAAPAATDAAISAAAATVAETTTDGTTEVDVAAEDHRAIAVETVRAETDGVRADDASKPIHIACLTDPLSNEGIFFDPDHPH